jgi:hypothetical protein
MATNDYRALRTISERQQIAIEGLLEGLTHAEAAERAGVHRVTVSKWRARHPGFRAELNRRRQELNEQRVARLRQLDATALDAVAAQLDASDPDVALKWLKLRGLSSEPYPVEGPTDADSIIDDLVAWESLKAEDAELYRIFDRHPRVDSTEIRKRVEEELAVRFPHED